MSSDDGAHAEVLSQNVIVAGLGGIRGFDLTTRGAQVAALSFWEVPKGEPGTSSANTYGPAAWESPTESPGWSDARLMALAVAYAYPWPSSCDNARLRKQAMDSTSR